MYTHYACTILMFLFGLKMLWEAWRMSPDETQEIQQEVQAELVRRGSIASNLSRHSQEDGEGGGDPAEAGASAAERAAEQNLMEQRGEEGEDEVQVAKKKSSKPKKTVQIQEKSLFGKKCYKIFK